MTQIIVICNQKQIIDNHSIIQHNAPNTKSSENYKGIYITTSNCRRQPALVEHYWKLLV